MVKLQFSKIKRSYKQTVYHYERISLHFPREFNPELEALRNKDLEIKIDELDGVFSISLSELKESKS